MKRIRNPLTLRQDSVSLPGNRVPQAEILLVGRPSQIRTEINPLTSATFPKSSTTFALASMTSFWALLFSSLLASSPFCQPRPSSRRSASRVSLSIYDEERTAVSLLLSADEAVDRLFVATPTGESVSDEDSRDELAVFIA